MIDEDALLQRILKLEEQALVEEYDQFNSGLYRWVYLYIFHQNHNFF